MSSTPIVPEPTPTHEPLTAPSNTTLLQEITKDIEIAKTKAGVFLTTGHIILIVLLAAAMFGGTYLYASRLAERADAKVTAAVATAQKAQETADTSAKQNAIFQAQTNQQLAQIESVNAALLAENKRLIAAISASNVALAKQKQVDAQMSPTDKSKRWESLVPTATVVPTPTGFNVDAKGGLLTLQDLEELPIQTQWIADLQTELTNTNKIVSNDQTALTAEKTARTFDLANDAAQLSACKAETGTVKAQLNAQKKATMRTRLRWFAGGFFTGWIVGVLK